MTLDEQAKQYFPNLLVRHTIGLDGKATDARQSAAAFCYLTKKLDWLYFDKVSPFQVRTYVEKKVNISPKGNPESILYGSKLTGKRTQHTHVDNNLLCTTWKTTNQQREEVGGMQRVVHVLSNYDKITWQHRQVMKRQTVNKLMEWMAKHGK